MQGFDPEHRVMPSSLWGQKGEAEAITGLRAAPINLDYFQPCKTDDMAPYFVSSLQTGPVLQIQPDPTPLIHGAGWVGYPCLKPLVFKLPKVIEHLCITDWHKSQSTQVGSGSASPPRPQCHYPQSFCRTPYDLSRSPRAPWNSLKTTALAH